MNLVVKSTVQYVLAKETQSPGQKGKCQTVYWMKMSKHRLQEGKTSSWKINGVLCELVYKENYVVWISSGTSVPSGG